MLEVNQPDSIDREPLHTRTIDMRAYRRPDGLFEVESVLTDTKPTDFKMYWGDKTVPAGTPIHELGLTLVFDENFVVHDIRTMARATPYEICPMAGASLKSLIGLAMTRGWNAAVRERLAKAENCTHLVGLLGPMATTAFQALAVVHEGRSGARDANGRPYKLDSCYAYNGSRFIVKEAWPDFYRTPEAS